MADGSFQHTRMNQGIKTTTIPPESYVCYRCGQKGHFIHNCPTNSDRAYDQLRTRVPAGVPKDFLQRVGEDHMQIVVQTGEWKKRQNLLTLTNVPEEFRCCECRGILNNACKSSCGHFFCEGCAVEKEKCVKCRKVIYSLSPNANKREEVQELIEKRAREEL